MKSFSNKRIHIHVHMHDTFWLSYSLQVRALHKQLQIANKVKTQAEVELKTTSQSLAQLKVKLPVNVWKSIKKTILCFHSTHVVPLFQDELQTTTKSYEGQLSMMSEHLAGMNEKLTQQKDEIDDLRSQLSVAKVSTSKVHALFMLTNFNVYTLFISSVSKITLFRVSMHVL